MSAERPSRGWRMLACIGGATALAALVSAYLFYDRYYRWTFNELGRAYDPVTHEVHLEQAGALWGGCSIVLLLAAMMCVATAVRRRRTGTAP
jgi:hypothetical protein